MSIVYRRPNCILWGYMNYDVLHIISWLVCWWASLTHFTDQAIQIGMGLHSMPAKLVDWNPCHRRSGWPSPRVWQQYSTSILMTCMFSALLHLKPRRCEKWPWWSMMNLYASDESFIKKQLNRRLIKILATCIQFGVATPNRMYYYGSLECRVFDSQVIITLFPSVVESSNLYMCITQPRSFAQALQHYVTLLRCVITPTIMSALIHGIA